MTASAELGAKGRLVIPAQVRQEAGVEIGQTLIARAEGAGRIVLETAAAVQDRVWAAAPGIAGPAPSVDDIRAVRDADGEDSDDAARRRAASPAQGTDADDDAGRALLDALGL